MSATQPTGAPGAWSYRTGPWFAVFGPHVTVLLPESQRDQVVGLWSLVDGGAGFDEVLDGLLASGLSRIPAFALVSSDDGPTRVLLRGAGVRATVQGPDGPVVLDGTTGGTWVERTVSDVSSLSVELVPDDEAAEGVDDADHTIDTGLVRVSRVDRPPYAPPVEQDVAEEPSVDDAAPVVVGAVETSGEDTVLEDAPDAMVDADLPDAMVDADLPDALGSVEAGTSADDVEVMADEVLAQDAAADEAMTDGATVGEAMEPEPAAAMSEASPADEWLSEETSPDASLVDASAAGVADAPPDDQVADEQVADDQVTDDVAAEPMTAMTDETGAAAVGEGVPGDAEVGPETELMPALGGDPLTDPLPPEELAPSGWVTPWDSAPPPPPASAPQPPAPPAAPPGEPVTEIAPPGMVPPPPPISPAGPSVEPPPPLGIGSWEPIGGSYAPPPPPPSAPPAPEDVDHDGQTNAGGEESAPPPPGIPGQPPAPPVTQPVAKLMISDGQNIVVDRVVLIGRAPEARRFTSTEQPMLVTVPSRLHEISSTHVEVRPGTGVDHGTAVVTDMGSTNGTVLVQPGLGPEDLKPGIAVQLIPGAIINLGDGITIQVTRP